MNRCLRWLRWLALESAVLIQFPAVLIGGQGLVAGVYATYAPRVGTSRRPSEALTFGMGISSLLTFD